MLRDLRSSIVLFATFLVSSNLVAQDKLPSAWETDAALRSICFVDHDFGWAVGDRGTILRTEDGGRNWQSISSARDMIWTQVQFLNDQVGWIAGGYFRGSLNRSVGILIQTTDGGQTWNNLSQKGVPFIQQLRFTDRQRGWMYCQGNSVHESGLLVTNDGGKSWQSAPGVPARPLVWGRQTSAGRFDGLGADGQWYEFDRTGIRHQFPTQLTALRDVARTASGQTVCIADRKLFARGEGDSFQLCSPGQETDKVHWNAVVCRGEDIWAVGAPGSVIVRSSNRGRDWKVYRTGSLAPLNAAYFLDSERGWAVGENGQIIATKDGGRTWMTQRNGELKLGVLNLATQTDQINTNCLALLSGSFGHRCGTAVLSDQQMPTRSDQWRITQGLNRIGVSSFDCQRLAADSPVFQLVSVLRTRRPAVVIVDEEDTQVCSVILEAIKRAADAKQFPEFTDLGIQPWQVEKVIAVSDKRELDQAISTDQYSAHLGRTASLQSRFASQLVPSADGQPTQNELNWRLVYSKSTGRSGNQGMTTGTAAYNNPKCRRSLEQIQIDNMQQFRSIANWNQSLAKLARLNVYSPIDEKSWEDQVTAATSGMDLLSLTFFLEDLEQVYVHHKKPIMADHTARLILTRALDSEVGERTLWKMIQRYGSSEANSELNRLVQERMASQSSSIIDANVRPAAATSPFDPVRPTASTPIAIPPEPIDVTPASWQNANQLIGIFQREFPDLSADPEYEIPIAWMKSKLGQPTSFLRILDAVDNRNLAKLQKRRVQREKNLMDSANSTMPSLVARQVKDWEVVLDGRLTEKTWRRPNSQASNQVLFGIDQKYLYLAGKYDLAIPVESVPQHRRVRDESLAGFDRVQLFIDFDRDYCSGIELTVDTRGSCNDAIWRDSQTRDPSYDPTWYVASRVDRDQWTFECAIPLSELPTDLKQISTGWIVGSRLVARDQPPAANVQAFLKNENLLKLRPSLPVVNQD